MFYSQAIVPQVGAARFVASRRARSGRRVCYSQAVAPLAGGRAFHIPRVARRTGCASVTGPKLGPKLAARFSRQKLYPQRATRGLQIQSGT